MNEKNIKRFELLYASLSEDAQNKIDTPNSGFPYMFSKAINFLDENCKSQSKIRASLAQNEFNLSESAILIIGMKQMIKGHGLTRDLPFTNLDVFGFSSLMMQFHFESTKRNTTYRYYLNGQKGILDEITFVHFKYGFQITLFNFI